MSFLTIGVVYTLSITAVNASTGAHPNLTQNDGDKGGPIVQETKGPSEDGKPSSQPIPWKKWCKWLAWLPILPGTMVYTRNKSRMIDGNAKKGHFPFVEDHDRDVTINYCFYGFIPIIWGLAVMITGLVENLKASSVMLPSIVFVCFMWLVPFINKYLTENYEKGVIRDKRFTGTTLGAFAGVTGTGTGLAWQYTANNSKRTWDDAQFPDEHNPTFRWSINRHDPEQQSANLRSFNNRLRSRFENTSVELPEMPMRPSGPQPGELMGYKTNISINDVVPDTNMEDYVEELFYEKKDLQELLQENFGKVDNNLTIAFFAFLAVFLVLLLFFKSYLHCVRRAAEILP